MFAVESPPKSVAGVHYKGILYYFSYNLYFFIRVSRVPTVVFVKARQKQIKRFLCEAHIHRLFQPCGMILLPRSEECLGVWELPPFLSVLEALLKEMPERGQDSRLRGVRARGGGRACWSKHSGLWARTGAAPVCQLQALPFIRENLLHTFDLFN